MHVTAIDSMVSNAPEDGFVPQLVGIQAAKTPGALALTHGTVSLSYRDLDQRATKLARRLRGLGVGADTVVGLHLDRSPASIVAALGIMRAGGAYLPLDPAYPQERLAWVWEDAQARVLITTKGQTAALPVEPEQVVVLDPEGGLAEPTGPPEPVDVAIRPASLAYVIYTSGSSGEPKGVEITHANLLNLVLWHRRAFQITGRDRASHLAALSFDAAVWEIWPYLTSGASLHLPVALARNDPEAVRDWLLSQGITIGFLPTPLAEQAMALEWPRSSALRLLLTGADTLHHHPPRQLPFAVVNNYGPTECTVVATSGRVLPEEHPERTPAIGRPIDNVRIHILDAGMRPVAAGVEGEIHIGGAGVARGYRRRPELTARRFVPDPFASEPGARLYKTGDLGCLLPDGQIAFRGRADEQIKIHGFRIEPAEIVKALNRHPAVRASAVVAREAEAGDRRLVAYLVLARDAAPAARPTHAGMREFLAAHLPPHFLPHVFVVIPALPATPTGKVDRAALPAPNRDNTLRDQVFLAPRTTIEQCVGAIVAGLLGTGPVGVEDNFFLQGGDSLLGTRLIAALCREFEVELDLLTIFEAPTVAALSAEIEARLEARAEPCAASADILETRAAVAKGGFPQ